MAFLGLDLHSRLNEDHSPLRILKSYLFIKPPIVAVGWTLTFEIAFYAIVAFSLLFSIDHKRRICCLIFFLIFLGAYSYWGREHGRDWRVFGLLSEFALGMIVFQATRNKNIHWRYGALTIIMSVVIFGASGKFYQSGPGNFMWAAGATLLLFGFVAIEPIVTWPDFVIKLGDASYSLYLVHLYVIAAVDYVFIKYCNFSSDTWILNLAFSVSCLIASVIFSFAFYYFIEKPMLSYLLKKSNFIVGRDRRTM